VTGYYRGGEIARRNMMDNSVMDNASDTNQTPVEAINQTTERMLPQSTVNELIGNAKREAAEKAAARAVEEYKRNQQSSSQQNLSNSGLTAEDVNRLASEVIDKKRLEYEKEAQEKAYIQAANNIVKAYEQKINAGRDKYQDFDEVTGSVNMGKYPYMVQLITEHVDNAADILYNLAQRRSELAKLERMCKDDLIDDAIYDIKRLSKSLKDNEEAAQIKNSKTPLSQQRPSNTGTDSGATLSVRDYKKLYKG
jgi:hypothetical protein